MKQKCKQCGEAVGPFRLRNQENAPKVNVSSKRHVRELCVACKRFGDCQNPNISDSESDNESEDNSSEEIKSDMAIINEWPEQKIILFFLFRRICMNVFGDQLPELTDY